MRLVLLGAPGCGKGTHSAWMIESFGVPQISTGDMLREAVGAGTELGQKAKGYMDAGKLLPDDVILDLVSERLTAADAAQGFILDGFPRTIPQAEGLAKLLEGRDEKLDHVVNIDLSRDELIRRLTSRRVCPQCKAVYNVEFKPPQQAGICDACGGEVIQRDDDTAETVTRRLGVYEEQTAPLIAHYKERGLLITIDGNAGFEETRARLEVALEI